VAKLCGSATLPKSSLKGNTEKKYCTYLAKILKEENSMFLFTDSQIRETASDI
jgi:hypothetical protein